MKKIFLGYSNKKSARIDKFKDNKKFKIFNTKSKIELKNLNNINLIISFDYEHRIDREILMNKEDKNLFYISYLSYNKD